MSKLVLIKNLKQISNIGKPTQQVVHFDICDVLVACKLYRDLDLIEEEKDYDVNLYLAHSRYAATFDKFDDGQRLMNDLVTYLQSDLTFLELDLLNYETK